jgi:hypothetical protein
VKAEKEALVKQIDEAFAAEKLGLGCRLQAEYRKRFGHDPLPEGMVEAEPEGPRMYVGFAGARTGRYRKSGASRRR